MSNTKTLDISRPEFSWMRGSAEALVKALGRDACRFVGGAVRDSLIEKEVSDVDLATTLAPEDVIKKLKAANIKVVPTGLKHGTVTAVFPDRHFEITTLRHDVETFGRKAQVAFHDDWLADAARRDFTINALYLDADGTLYDYFDGQADLKARKVHFIGDAAKRIEEDALRILRLFRFHAWYGDGVLDPLALKAVSQKLDLLEILSGERVAAEFLKLLKAPAPIPLLKVMKQIGVLDHLFPGFTFDFAALECVVEIENALNEVSGLRRLGVFLACNKNTAKVLKLSNKVSERLAGMAQPLPADKSTKESRKQLYHHGKQVFVDRVILTGGDLEKVRALLDFAANYDIPEFPVGGNDLLKQGINQGVEMGNILKDLEDRWMMSDFTLSKKDLLKLL